ncbi:MAG: GTP 3',8-cyclase MoaA [Desulfobulbus sp.]|jgi:cyclic pyranopterin phosphate synthase|uniref:GTP 3',8-cyclase MoaA n=1 Tax=Desulfobulbus sp. TaxID=895 RepID=UPI00283C0621|nr:GTP 3',8-cyclase MoaA [Desulfobulbus sp.]MDR2550242.1 GTP 3',8-cyclase MoaA [Desulfobulbus sp.]
MIHDKTPIASAGTGLVDLFARPISYLRLSLTDRCNLRCRYCVTEEESNGCLTKLTHDELLSYEELLRVVRVAVGMGIAKVRLTGGEPLVRRNVMQFIRDLTRIKGLDDVRITTNGVLLERYGRELYEAGVTKVNISLDSFKPERVAAITGVDCFGQVWRGVETALALGFSPVKLNMVAMRHVNDDELTDFALLSRRLPVQVRFIEFMPIGESSRWNADTYIGTDEIMARIAALGELIPMEKGRSDGPAKVYRLGADAVGTLGFISPISHHFCSRCNRLRLTSSGGLRSCLLHDYEIDLRPVLRDGSDDEALRQALLAAIRNKPEGHHLDERLRRSGSDCHGRMSRIGG